MTLLSLVACGWNHLPDGQYVEGRDLWNPDDAVATADGLYVKLANGTLVRLRPGNAEEVEVVDLRGAKVERIEEAPGGEALVAIVSRTTCTDPDARTPDDCARRDREESSSILLVRDGKAQPGSELPGSYNTVRFSDDGNWAIAWLDLSSVDELGEVVNLTGVAVVDARRDETVLVQVGFAADRVLFVEEAGVAVRAVVLSQNEVALLELAGDGPRVSVTYPLTLDADEPVAPDEVVLTPDGGYALVSAAGRSDLYALDLRSPSINLVELSAPPAALAVDPASGVTAVVSGWTPTLDLVDTTSFDVGAVALDEPMDHAEVVEGEFLLYSTVGYHDAYRYDPVTGDLVEYRLQNPADRVFVAPTGEFAVALTRPESGGVSEVDALYDRYPGMEVLDLRSDEATPFLLEGRGLDLAFSAEDGRLDLVLLQEGVDYLYRYDCYGRTESILDLGAPARRIGTMPDGRFFVTHDAPLGLVTFLDPATDRRVEIGGFATLGIASPETLAEAK